MKAEFEERNGEARPFDNPRHQVPHVFFDSRGVPASRMFVIREGLANYKLAHPGEPVLDASQGDGGQSLPGLSREELAQALHDYLPSVQATKYGTPDGARKLREAVLVYYHRLGGESWITPDHVVMVDGGRDGLQKWCQATVVSTGTIGGYLITSAAPWLTYLHGPYVDGMNILCAPGDSRSGFRLTTDGIDVCVARAKHEGRPIVGMIITSPDNPTGTYYEQSELHTLIEHAARRGVRQVFLDLMYQTVLDDDVLDTPRYDLRCLLMELSPAARAIVTIMDGLTKSIGASNVRSAHLTAASRPFAGVLRAIASHTVLPNVLGEAVALAFYDSSRHQYREPRLHPWCQRVAVPTERSRVLARQRFRELGIEALVDQGYYAFVNVKPWLGRGFPHRIGAVPESAHADTVENLTRYLTSTFGVAVVPGDAFLQPNWVRFSVANEPGYTACAIERLHQGLSALQI